MDTDTSDAKKKEKKKKQWLWLSESNMHNRAWFGPAAWTSTKCSFIICDLPLRQKNYIWNWRNESIKEITVCNRGEVSLSKTAAWYHKTDFQSAANFTDKCHGDKKQTGKKRDETSVAVSVRWRVANMIHSSKCIFIKKALFLWQTSLSSFVIKYEVFEVLAKQWITLARQLNPALSLSDP